MNRDLWNGTLSRTDCPAWPCPVCRTGTLALLPKSLASEETITSVRLHQDANFDPDWIEYSFTAWAHCTNARCKQKFAIAGFGGVSPEQQPDGDLDWEDFFKPLLCHPTLHIISIPEKCPDDIREELLAAFRVFWAHPMACAGRIRVALELLMNHIGVAKRRKNQKGRFLELSLHARIEAFAIKEKAIGSQLMALKWLGNTGSHDGNLSTTDLLDAFEILEHSLSEILDRRSARVAQLAKTLLRKHKR